MIVCPKCNAELDDNAKFCMSCGAKIEEAEPIESAEETPVAEETPAVEEAPVEEETSATEPAPVVEEDPVIEPIVVTAQKPAFKLSKKLIAIISAAVALILVAVIVVSLFSGGKTSNHVLYLKDEEVYYTGISKIDPWQITNHLIDEDIDIDDDDTVYSLSYMAAHTTRITSDGKKIFYIDKIEGSSEGANLYCRSLTKPDAEPEKIDSDVISYSVSEAGDLVTYLKGEEDSDLYQHNLKDKEKIASQVVSFVASKNGKKIGYIDEEDRIYVKTKGKDKEKVDSDVDEICHIDEEKGIVYYIKDGNLYKNTVGKDKAKIASDVSDVITVYESGKIYYLKEDVTKGTLMDYVDDDMKAADEAMTEPVEPEFVDTYTDFDEWMAAYDEYSAAYDEYLEQRGLYYEKEDRDELREELMEEEIEISSYTLCYYDGKESKEVSKEYSDYNRYSFDKPVIVFTECSKEDIKQVKMSEIDSIYDVEDVIDGAQSSEGEKIICVNGTKNAVTHEDATNFNFADDGKAVYYKADIDDDDDHGTIYKVGISGDKLQKAEKYDSNVYYSYYISGNLIYYKDVGDSGTGDLYLNKTRVDYDVIADYITYIEQQDSIVYMTDYDDNEGTLKIYKNGKAEKIADDVSNYIITPNGEVVYLHDYSTKHYTGTLYVYKNKKSVKIDDDVSAIIQTYDYTPINLYDLF